MTDDRSIERAARSWLEAGPTRAPEHAVDAALVRIETTPQERDWPLPLGDLWIHVTGRAMTGIVLMAVVLLGGILLLQPGPGPGPATSPSPRPTMSASPLSSPSPSAPTGAVPPPVLTATFTSPRNGYSVLYPGDWTTTPATVNWEAGAVNQWGSTALDELRGSSARFVGASQPLAAGETADQWLDEYGVGACLGPRANWLSVPIGSATGLLDADGCPAPNGTIVVDGRLFDAVVIVGGRAYNFTMDGELSHADFLAVLATVTLDPASAIDGSPSP